MTAVDPNIYVAPDGTRYIKVRNVGYSVYAYEKPDGGIGMCGGCVGEDCGWATVPPAVQTEEDRRFFHSLAL